MSKKSKSEGQKKRKEKGHALTTASEKPDAPVNGLTDEEITDITAKKKKRKVQKEAEEEDGNFQSEEDDADDTNAKHKRLLEKREKSLRKAEKLAKKAEKLAAAKEGDEEQASEVPEELHALEPLPQPEPVPEPEPLSLLSSLPPWLASPNRIAPTLRAPFTDLGVEDEVTERLKSKGFNEAFAIQAAVLPLLLPGSRQEPGDILVEAATGSGKTLSYALPIVESISRKTVTRLRGLVVMPTRELVTQAREVFEICAGAFSGKGRKRVKIGTALGNETFKTEQAALMDKQLRYDPVAYKEQQRRLNLRWESSDYESDGEDDRLLQDEEQSTLPDHVVEYVPKVDVIICTPGRLVEHLKSTPGFSLDLVRWLVVDEADRLLDQSFQQWLDTVMTALAPQKLQTQTMLQQDRLRKIILSATMTRDLGRLSGLKLYRPKLVMVEGAERTEGGLDDEELAHNLPSTLVEHGIKVEDESIKPLYLLELLQANRMVSISPKEDSRPPKVDVESDSDTSSSGSSSEEDSSSSDENSSDDASASSEDESDDDTSSSEDDSDDESSSPDDSSSVSSTTSSKSNDRKIQPSKANGITPHGVLIFTKSNQSAVRLGRLIALLEPTWAKTIGTLTSTTRSSTRRATIRAFDQGKLSIIVASDLVSRGLDLRNLAHVINYDLPTSLTSYVHRVGRTARAGKSGNAWTLFTNVEGRWFWNEIARGPGIRRAEGKKVERVNMKADIFNDKMRTRYENALERLGREASAVNYRAHNTTVHN